MEQILRSFQTALVPLIVVSVYSIYYFVNNYYSRKRIEGIYRSIYGQLSENFDTVSMWQENGPSEYFIECNSSKLLQGVVIKYNTNYPDLFSLLTKQRAISFYAFLSRKVPTSFALSKKPLKRDDLIFCKSSTLGDWSLQVESRQLFDQLSKNYVDFFNIIKKNLVSFVVSDLSKNASEVSVAEIPLTVELIVLDDPELNLNLVFKKFIDFSNEFAKTQISGEVLKKGEKSRQELKKSATNTKKVETITPKLKGKKEQDDRVRLMGSTSSAFVGAAPGKKKKSNKFKVVK
eukprot:NODE_871_length_3383_cov_0.938794.p2 type:complete len:290 gc:universal NODE_871_length_3383_cov_0.938794:364-1233(+)